MWLVIGIHGRFFQKPFSRVEKVAGKGIVEPGLVLLYEGKFHGSDSQHDEQKEGLGPRHRGSDVHARI